MCKSPYTDQRKTTTINDANTTPAETVGRDQLLAGRTADGGQPEPAPPTPYYAVPPPTPLQRLKSGGSLLAKIAAPIALLFSKLKFLLVALKLLTFGKFLLGGGSMLLSMWAWAALYGWPFGVGIVLLIFIHECGHALAARLRGIPTGIMVFIPLMGAFVTTKRYGKNIVEDAFIGIMGPVFGTLAGIGCLAIYALTPAHSPFWLALAQWSFVVNLFNLLPIPPLDGSRLPPLFVRRPATGEAAKASSPVSPADRWKYTAAYVGLAVLLAVLGFGLPASLHPLAIA